jgi:hypothetical protein
MASAGMAAVLPPTIPPAFRPVRNLKSELQCAGISSATTRTGQPRLAAFLLRMSVA